MSYYCTDCYAQKPSTTTVATRKIGEDHVCENHYLAWCKENDIAPEPLPAAAVRASKPSPVTTPEKLALPAADPQKKPAKAKSAPEPPGPNPIPDGLPFKVAVYSEAEYIEKFNSTKFADPEIVELLRWIDSVPLKSVATIEPQKEDEPTLLKGRIRRTFAKYFSHKPYTLKVSQQTNLNHVTVTKVAK
jgi:hypothetical protein